MTKPPATAERAPAVRLRAAADLLERRAAAATDPRWQPEYAYLDHSLVQGIWVDCGTNGEGCDGLDCYEGTHSIGGFDSDANNRWAILASPHLGPILAAILRGAATIIDIQSRDLCDPAEPHAVEFLTAMHRHELDLADAILTAEADT